MARSDIRISVPVVDRILLHLWEQDHQADHYLVTQEMTRPGIAEICALHPPNVSRSMRDLMSNGWVAEHTRTIRGDDRRQKTWQLTDEGRAAARGGAGPPRHTEGSTVTYSTAGVQCSIQCSGSSGSAVSGDSSDSVSGGG